MILLKSLLLKNQALRFRPSADPHLWSWSLLFLRQCTHERARVNTLRKHRLSCYSQQILHETLKDCAFDYDRIDRGIVFFYRSAETLERGVAHMQILADDGQAIEVLDRDALVKLEPSIAGAKELIAGGIYCPSDETGDCNKFTQALADLAAQRGAEFHYGTDIRAIEVKGDRVRCVSTGNGELRADAYVLALGSYSPKLAKPLGLNLPIYPVKGYSITLPIVDAGLAPVSTVMDETYKIAITRLGDRIRVGGMAELAGFDPSLNPRRRETLAMSVESLFGGAGDQARADFWTGFRPMTPDGTPIVGRSKISNLWLNTGHGTLGWTMSAGSARVLADMISERVTEIDGSDLGLARYAPKPRRRAPVLRPEIA